MIEQKEIQSMNILMTNILRDDSDLPLQIAKIFGSHNLIQQEQIINQFEKELEKIRLTEYFPKEDITLEGARFITWQIGEDKTLSPDISLIKHSYDNNFLLNIIISNFSDLDILDASTEVSFVLQALSGVHRRIEIPVDLVELSDEEKLQGLKHKLKDLGNFYHWQIFEENSMRGGIEKIGLAPMLITVISMRAHTMHDEIQCIGECQRTFNKESQGSGINCECGGELIIAPPYLKIKNASFVFPERIDEIISVDESAPSNFLNLIQKAMFPREVSLSFNRFPDLNFSTIVTIPSSSYFRSLSTNDTIKVTFEYKELDNDDILIFAFVTDTRYNESKLIPATSLPVIMRDIQRNVRSEFDWEAAIEKSQMGDWKVSPYISYADFSKFASLKSLIPGTQEGENSE